MIVLDILDFVVGSALVLAAVLSAVRTFVVPRGVAPDGLTRGAFVVMRYALELPMHWSSHERRERSLAYYAPVTLLTLPVVWLTCVLLGYTAIYRALGASSWSNSIATSRLSLLYLGADIRGIKAGTLVAFSETVSSLLLAAILVSYLPAVYAAFSQREQAVTGLETSAGTPPSPYNMLKRFFLIRGIDQMESVWVTWRAWFEMVEETHTALMPLVFYRSPQPHRSWVTAAGAVLDAASLAASTLDRPRDPKAELCIRAGYICLQRIAGPLKIPYSAEPAATDPISISRAEYDALYDSLMEVGIPLKSDRDQAWRDFAGWRVNYDAVLIGLAVLTVAPHGVWSSDRVPSRRPVFVTASRSARRAAAAAIRGEALK